MNKKTTFFFAFIFLIFTTQAQVAVTENFDANGANLPLGWLQNEIVGSGTGNDFTVVTTGTNPTTGPSSPSYMVKYDSYAAASGDEAFLSSIPYDFSTRGAANPTVSFRMYRSTLAGADSMAVYVNHTPDLSGTAVLLGTVSRNNATNVWDSITFIITNTAFNTTSNYIIFKGITGSGVNNGGNIYLDNVRINTYPGNMTYVSSAAYQINFPMPQTSANQQILKLEIIVAGAANPCAVTALNLNTNGTTSLLEITNAKIYYTAGSEDFQTINQFGATINSPIGTNISFTGSDTLVNGKNYFWLTYSVTGAVIGNLFDGDWIDFTMSGNCSANPYIPSVQAPAGARFIDYNYCTTNYSTGTTTSRYIDDVILQGEPGTGKIDNTSSCRALSSPWYTFYPPKNGFTTTLKQGEEYEIKTRMGARTPFSSGSTNSNNGHVQNNIVWIDFNRNGVFESWERIYEGWYANGGKYMLKGWDPTTVSPPSGGCAPRTTINNAVGALVGGRFKVPNVGANIAGPTRMRVRFVRYSRSTTSSPAPSNPGSLNPQSPPNTNGATSGAFTSQHSPCGTYSGWIAYGEAEDYVVTISPPCSPGEWLGFTDDWDTPTNWCDGVPRDTSNVLIPTNPAGGKMPIIQDSTFATCNNIAIQTGASVTVRSPKNGSFIVHGNLTNNGELNVDDVFINNFVIGTGTLVGASNQAQTPFTRGGSVAAGGATVGRSQQLYLASELLAKGFTQGDAISTIGFQLKNVSVTGVTPTLSQFNIRIGHTSGNGSTWPIAYPTPGSGSSGGTTVPFMTFNGTPSVYSPGTYTPVTNTDNLYNLNTPFIWDGSSNILVEVCFRNANSNSINQYEVNSTQTTGMQTFKSVWVTLQGFSTPQSVVSCGGATTTTSSSYFGNILDKRANLIVQAYSPNGIYPIHVRGDWINNGSFKAGRSNVIFDGNSATPQLITGTSLNSFSRLTVQKSTGVVRLERSIEIDSSLYLAAGPLELSSYTLTLKNPAANSTGTITTLSDFHSLTTVPAWARNTGFIRAETMPSSGIGYIHWNIGTAPALRTYQFPFGNGAQGSNSGDFVPVDIDYNAGANLGSMKVSTYATPPNNLEMPTGVGHINGSVLSPNDPNMIDRYWIMEKSGAATTGAGFKIRWAAGEVAAPPTYFAQRWWGTGWPNPGIGTNSPANTIEVTAGQLDGYTVSGAPGGWFTVNNWAAAGVDFPLPIELLSFDAQLKDDEVHLKWTTASEKDNDYFTIEKTRDANEFIFVKKLPSLVNTSNSVTDYSTIDPDPLKGLSYYRLGQTDYDGTTTFSKLVPINYNLSVFEIVSTISTERNLIVAYGYDGSEPVNYFVTDMLGRIMTKREDNETVGGTNILKIDVNGWTEGVYFITLYNSEKSISRKIFYSKP